MPHLSFPGQPIRFETGITASTLLRKGWTQLPAQPNAGDTWDGTQWVTPPPPVIPPDYASLADTILESALMSKAVNKQTPSLSLSTLASGNRSLDEAYTALNKVAAAYDVVDKNQNLTNMLTRLARKGDNSDSVVIARFQSKVNAWVTAVGFDVAEKATLQGYLTSYCPTRNYTV